MFALGVAVLICAGDARRAQPMVQRLQGQSHGEQHALSEFAKFILKSKPAAGWQISRYCRYFAAGTLRAAADRHAPVRLMDEVGDFAARSRARRAMPEALPAGARTLADYAQEDAFLPKDLPDLGVSGTRYRALNADFVPRLGWKGTVFPSVLSPSLASILVSLLVMYLYDFQEFKGIDPTAHTVLGVLVSFLAVFRTQQAYNRYWESRGHLGVLMAAIVDHASTASVHLGVGKDAAEAKLELARLLRLYFSEVVRFLRKVSRDTKRVSNYWLPEDAIADFEESVKQECDIEAKFDECELLEQVARPPVLVLQWIRAHIFAVGVEGGLLPGETDGQRMQSLELGLEKGLKDMQTAFNGCAKIGTTPAPQPYTQMGRWLVFWFVFTVPFALIRAFGSTQGALIAADVLLAFGYYGLDYCANQLQNPFIAEFGDAQLDGRFLQAVCADVDLLLGTQGSRQKN